MNLPLQFPDPQQEARSRGQEFQRLSSSDRWGELAALFDFGWKMVTSSPNRLIIEQRMQEQEAEAQRIQREIFRRHGQ